MEGRAHIQLIVCPYQLLSIIKSTQPLCLTFPTCKIQPAPPQAVPSGRLASSWDCNQLMALHALFYVLSFSRFNQPPRFIKLQQLIFKILAFVIGLLKPLGLELHRVNFYHQLGTTQLSIVPTQN